LVAGLCYSTAMKGADLVWDEEKLEHFIADPDELVPGNSMKPHGGRRVDALSALREAAFAGLGLALFLAMSGVAPPLCVGSRRRLLSSLDRHSGY
jgi:hypothetical protein